MSDDKYRAGDESTLGDRLLGGGRLQELVSKAVATGVRSVFATQEGVRKVAENIPKEVVSFIADQMDGMRGDIFGVLATELRAFLDRINVGQELQRALTALTLQVTMEVRFVPNKDGVKPDVKMRVRPKRSRKAEPESKDEEA